MHAGNLSFFLSERPLALAPVYDMLPMAYAPGSTGSMLSQVYDISLDAAIPGSVWLEMQPLASHSGLSRLKWLNGLRA